MENRGRKRAGPEGRFLSDKRACSSSDFRLDSSCSSLQNHTLGVNNSISKPPDCDMETSTSSLVSDRSEDEEYEYEYSSDYSDSKDEDESDQIQNSLHNQRGLSGYNGRKFEEILLSLTDDAGPSSGPLAALTELCDFLSFSTSILISGSDLDSLAPVLVALAKNETNPEIMLLAIRAITYLCDAYPRSSFFLVEHDVIPALCARLMDIMYLDLAEQCLLALEKISHNHSIKCLQAGVIMAVLNYIDFFSISIQRIALSTIANMCKNLPSESSLKFMEAVPILCNLLQNEDKKLVENAATCLIRIVDRVNHSSEMLDELCKYGLALQVTNLIAMNNGTTISHTIYAGLIGVLSRLASGSVVAIRTLFELNIGSKLKRAMSIYDLSQSLTYFPVGCDVHSDQVPEVLKLLNELLPPLVIHSEDDQVMSEKEKILVDQPELLWHFGMDILPLLIQAVNSSANLSACYGCLSVINKIIYFCRSDMLLDLLKTTNISSFLAGVFARKDHHVLILALKIVKTVLQELHDVFVDSFRKEGIIYAIDALVTPENCSQSKFPTSSSTQLSSSSNKKLAEKDDLRCLCYAFGTDQRSSSEMGVCRLDKDFVHYMAKDIKVNYFEAESQNSEIGLTPIIKKLRTLSADLSGMMNISMNRAVCAEQEENMSYKLCQIMAEFRESMSTFEFTKSGIVKSLVNYLCNGQYLDGKEDHCELWNYLNVIPKRFEMFTRFSLSSTSQHGEDMPLMVLVRKLQSALSSLENFSVILNHVSRPRNFFATIPTLHQTMVPCIKLHFVKEEWETALCNYDKGIEIVEPFSSFDAIESFLWPRVSTCGAEQPIKSLDQFQGLSKDIPCPLPSDARCPQGKDSKSCSSGDTTQKLIFYLDGRQIDRKLTIYQAILQLQLKAEHDTIVGPKFWDQVYKVTYRKSAELEQSNHQNVIHGSLSSNAWNSPGTCWQNVICSSCKCISGLQQSSPLCEILFLLKILESLNKSAFHLISHARSTNFSEGKDDNLDNLMVTTLTVPQTEFVSNKLTEKLEQQMQDSVAVSIGSMPSWCGQLMAACPFLFSFEARCKYFMLTAFGSSQDQPLPFPQSANSNASNYRRSLMGSFPRKKFQVQRSHIMDSASKMMNLHARHKAILEVEYYEEVGTGLGPTMEFYTLVSDEFQKTGLGMWREDHSFCTSGEGLEVDESEFVAAPLGLFPRPWSAAMSISNGIQFSEVIKNFILLGQVVAKALQDGRVLDLPLSKSFYKLILQQELNIYDIQSFDPGLGRVLLEFQALVGRKRILESVSGKSTAFISGSCFRNTRIEDLCLDFTLPGYPDYLLTPGHEHEMVNMVNLEDYVSLTVDATVDSGLIRQVEAFKSGFNQVFPVESLQIFTAEELEHLLCGERHAWASKELLEHIKFDHGYTASSPPIINLLEIIQEFQCDQQRAFLQFVTGARRLPPGGFAALNPKLTIVRKHCYCEWADGDLPSVMTCANYLKLPPYSTKEIMRERLLYAIKEGQGSFHLS